MSDGVLRELLGKNFETAVTVTRPASAFAREGSEVPAILGVMQELRERGVPVRGRIMIESVDYGLLVMYTTGDTFQFIWVTSDD